MLSLLTILLIPTVVSTAPVCRLNKRAAVVVDSYPTPASSSPVHASSRHSSTSTASASSSTSISSGQQSGSTVAAAWFQGWSSDFPPSAVSWSKYTHVTYSFAITVQDGSLDLSGSGDSTGLKTFVDTAHSHKVNALASIGGWTGSGFWSNNVATEDSRSAFVDTVTNFIKTYELDGVDFDWEYPVIGGQVCNNYLPDDTAHFLAFVTALRSKNPNIIMTAAAGITPWKDSSGSPSSDVSGFAAALDYVAIMNYDEYGQWSTTAGPNAALDDSCAASQQGSAVSAVKAWTAAGIPAHQLVLGVASYGHAFNVSKTQAFTSGSSDSLALFPQYSPWTLAPGEAATEECGQPAPKDVQYTFAELVKDGFLNSKGTAADGIQSTYDQCSQTPFIYNEAKDTYVSYDDAQSFAAKGKFIQSSGLRGFAMWEASGDYQDILLDSIRSSVGLS